MRLTRTALAVTLLAAGCSTGSTTSALPSPSTISTPAPTVTESCPVPTGRSKGVFPKDAPAGLPRPGASTVTSTTKRGGVTLVSFTTPTSLRSGVLFVLDKLPKAGFTLGRGDAEQGEADAPFAKDDLRGLVRLRVTAPCATEWVLAYTRNSQIASSGSPLLPRPAVTATLNPFG